MVESLRSLVDGFLGQEVVLGLLGGIEYLEGYVGWTGCSSFSNAQEYQMKAVYPQAVSRTRDP